MVLILNIDINTFLTTIVLKMVVIFFNTVGSKVKNYTNMLIYSQNL